MGLDPGTRIAAGEPPALQGQRRPGDLCPGRRWPYSCLRTACALPPQLAGGVPVHYGRHAGMLGTIHWIAPTPPAVGADTIDTRSLVVVTGSNVTWLKTLSASG